MNDRLKSPESRRIDRAAMHVEAHDIAQKITGRIRRDPRSDAFHDFLSGYDAGMEDAGKGELLCENNDLHGRFMDLEFGHKDVVALRQFMDDVIVGALMHDMDKCECVICTAHRLYLERTER